MARNEIVVSIVATTDGLTRGVKKAQAEIESGLGKSIEKMDGITRQAGAQMKREFGQIARAAEMLGVALEVPGIASAGMAFRIAGAAAVAVASLRKVTTASKEAAVAVVALGAAQSGQAFVNEGAAMGTVAAEAAASTSVLSKAFSFLGGVVSKIVKAFVAVVSVATVVSFWFLSLAAVLVTLGLLVGDWLRGLWDGEAANEKLAKSVYRVTEAMKYDNKVLEELNKAQLSYNDALAAAAAKSDLLGERQDALKERLSATKKMFLETFDALQKLMSEQSEAPTSDREAKINTLQLSFFTLGNEVGRLTKELALYDSTIGNLEASQKKFNGAIKEAGLRATLFGDKEEALRAKQTALKDVILETQGVLEALNAAQRASPSAEQAEQIARLTAMQGGYTASLAATTAEIEKQAAAKKAAEDAKRTAEEDKHSFDIPTIQADQLKASEQAFAQWAASLQANMADVQSGVMEVTNSITSGVGNAFAQALVYGQNFGDAMREMLKSVAATIISSLIELGIQMLIYIALKAVGLMADTGATLAAYAAQTFAAAFAAMIGPATGLFLFAGPAVAAGYASTAVGTMLAGAAAAGAAGKAAGTGIGALGAAGMAEGGMITGPTLAVVGEAGDEFIMPRSDYEKYIQGGRGDVHITLEMDGRRTAEVVVPHIPGVVRRAGIRGA